MNKLDKRINTVGRALLLVAAIFVADAFISAPHANAYVARRTTVSGPRGTATRTTVAGPGGVANRTTVAGHGAYYGRTTAVGAGGVGIRAAGIRTLPAGYRPVYVGGVRYYTVGGVYYRPVIQNGVTTYVVTTP